MELQRHQKLGDYEILAELGKGGMGKVYLARRGGRAGFERLFAVKVLLEDMVDEPDALLMFHDEANIASRIHHPNVVGTVDVGSTELGHYLVMEYVEGCSFHDLLRRNREKRPPRLLIPIMIDALRGLHAAHELESSDGRPMHLVHRDFSPQNLLIGTDGACRVTDFGIAKVSVRLSHTRQGINKGKLSYMAPEQLSAARDIDRRADIWAAGVVLWSALTGAYLFRGESEAETITNILRHAVPPPSAIRLKPPKYFDPICLKALRRPRRERYATALEMADELYEVALAQGAIATPTEVATWVKETFKEDLELRQAKIREADSSPSKAMFVLPQPSFPETPLPEMFAPSLEVESAVDPEGVTGLEVSTHRSPDDTPEQTAPTAIESFSTNSNVKEEETAPTAIEKLPAADVARRPASPTNDDGTLTQPIGIEPDQPLIWWRRPRGIASVAVVIAIAVGVAALLGFSREEAPDTGASPTDSSLGEAAFGATEEEVVVLDSDESTDETASESGALEIDSAVDVDHVRLTFRNVPEGATIILDGSPTEGSPLEIARDDSEHEIAIEAEGYHPWTMSFLPEADTIVYVDLTRRRRGRRRPTKSNYRLVRNPGF